MGKLIVIDGLDGSGKNTQATLLYRRLLTQGKKAHLVSFPQYDSPACEPVKMYLSGAFGSDPDAVNPYAASAFFAVDRYASFTLNWKQDYEAGEFIIANRYTTANAIHQLTKLAPEEHEAFLSWLYDFEFNRLGLPAPDRTILLKLPVEMSLSLIETRGNEKDIHENRHHLEKAYRAAETCARAWHWTVVDCLDETGGLDSIAHISEKIDRAIEDLI